MTILAAEKPFFQSAAQLVAERHFELQERMEKMRQFAASRSGLDIVREQMEKMQAAEAERRQRYQGMAGGLAEHERFGNIRQFAATGIRASDLAAAKHLTLTGTRRESLANMAAEYSGILAERGTFSMREHLEKMQADAAKEWRESMDRAAAVTRINVDEYLKATGRHTLSPLEYILERLIRPNPAILALMRGNPPSEPKMPVSEPLRTPPPQAQSPLPAPQPVPQPENGISARHQPPAPAVSERQREPQFVIDGKAVSETEYQDWVV